MRTADPIKLLLAVLLFAAAGHAQWRRVESNSLAWLHAVHFADAHRGWAAGSGGTLLSTDDGGLNWKKKWFPSKDNIRDVYFRDYSVGWALCERDRFAEGRGGNSGYILTTENGGADWSMVEMPEHPGRFVRFVFRPGGEMYVIGEGGMIFTVPGGAASSRGISLPSRFLMMGGSPVGGSGLVLVGGGGSIFFTEDRGLKWHAGIVSPDVPDTRLNAVHFTDYSSGWAVGNNGTILFSGNAGRTWKLQLSGTVADLLDARFRADGAGFAVGDNGTILAKTDVGDRWSPENSGTKHRLERIAFAGERAFVVGFGGTILMKRGTPRPETGAESGAR